jgi:Beta-lactamase superfamily domain
MRIDFVGHATLLIQHGELRLLSDPWWIGPAYRDSWYPYPLPVPERYDLSRVDAIYISHSHEDHLHAPTLRQLLSVAPDVQAIIPLRADTSMRDYLRRIGVRRIKELASGSSFNLHNDRDSLRLTLFTHIDDSLLAVQSSAETLLNLNDALHSSRRELIVEYCRILRARFPSIDYLFCGFGGASFFPNCVHVDGKDDVAVARARERFFLHNFGLISELLQPKLAFPFAAHFVLPDEQNWWISATRLQLEPPSQTLCSQSQSTAPTQFHDLEPGDYVEDGRVQRSGAVRVTDPDAVRAMVRAHYGSPPAPSPLAAAAFESLVDEVRSRVTPRVGAPLDAVIILTDYPSQAIHVHVTPSEVSVNSVDPGQQAQVVVRTRSDLIRSTLRSPFGKDLISIGYGGQFHLRSTADLASSPHDRLLQLLAPTQPRWRQHLRQRPYRTLRYLVGDPSMRLALFRRLRPARFSPASQPEPAPYEIRDWVAAPEG